MALPSTFAQQNPFQRGAGVVLNLVPTDISLRLQVQRTSELSTGGAASTAAVDIVELPPIPEAGQTYLDSLPLDGARRFYRSRHAGDGVDPSTWTEWTTGHKPVSLGDQELLTGVSSLSVYPIKRDRKFDDDYFAIASANATGSEFRGNLYLPSTYVINVGTTGTPSSITKIVRIPYSSLLPTSYQSQWVVQSADRYITNSGVASVSFVGGLQLPPGVTLTQLSQRANAVNALGTIVTALYQGDDSGGAPTSIASVASTGTTWATNASTVFSATVSTAATYYLGVVMNDTVSSTDTLRFAWAELTYTMPSYDKSL